MNYLDGNDYLYLEPNIKQKQYEHLEGCVFCGENKNVTITDSSDFCHECGYVYK